jgi:hypothetical protein
MPDPNNKRDVGSGMGLVVGSMTDTENGCVASWVSSFDADPPNTMKVPG